MKLLALELSSATGSVALAVGGDVRERYIETPRAQAATTLQLVDELLAEAGLALGALDGVVFGRGPGSFTGLRVAAAVAQGFALASGVPLLPVSSLAALAQRAFRSAGAPRALACVDARMGEVYYGVFEIRERIAQAAAGEHLGAPSALAAVLTAAGASTDTPGAAVTAGASGAAGPLDPPWAAVGSGFSAYPEVFAPLLAGAERVMPELVPSAQDLLPRAAADHAAGRFTAVAQALPVYLRDHTAWRRGGGS